MGIISAFIIVATCYFLVSSAFPEKVHKKEFYSLEASEYLFEQFVKTYNKQYKNREEYIKRHAIFKENLEKINYQNENDEHVVYGINNLSDLTHEEFINAYTGVLKSNLRELDTIPYELRGNVPDSLDWRDRNVVTEIKNQKDCGSCYCFSAIGNIEGQHAIKHGELISLSEQQGLDCNPSACVLGGQVVEVMNSLAKIGGSVREKDYPYTAEKGTCDVDKSKIVVKVTGGFVLNLNETGLEDAVANLGPLASVVNSESIQGYRGGILRATNCPDNETDHAILIVGYGTNENGVKFWIIKNSWGVGWGEQGYLRLERGVGACGIGSENYQSTVA